uniref:Thymidylate kinase n=1 Tax=Glossina morsitans morsitans TaxID=37546 RepID=A0A1B0G795_GLOMM
MGTSSANKRGAFIVLEGCDHTGKSTQSRLLHEFLQKRGVAVKRMAFPERKSNIGQTINAYLTNKKQISDEAIHLLFTANRWEFQNEMKELLLSGTSLIVDRYLYSGIAYSTAKGLSYEWCLAPEKGLLRPDIVFYMKMNSIDGLLERGNFGDERYEKKEFQAKVSNVFEDIYAKERHYWHEINAELAGDDIHKVIVKQTECLLKNLTDKTLEYMK